jgi:hypothetical protein
MTPEEQELTLEELERLMADGRAKCLAKAAELGHTMGPWRFRASPSIITQTSECSTCGAHASVDRVRREYVKVSTDENGTSGGDLGVLIRCPNSD